MTGVYVGGSAGGLVTAVLLGLPGTPSAIATTFDGHPMAKKGEPGRAIWLGTGPRSRWPARRGLPHRRHRPARESSRSSSGRGSSSRFSCSRCRWSRAWSRPRYLKGLMAGALGSIVHVLGNDPVMGQERRSRSASVPARRHRFPASADRGLSPSPIRRAGGATAARRPRRSARRNSSGASSCRHAKVFWDIFLAPVPAPVVRPSSAC